MSTSTTMMNFPLPFSTEAASCFLLSTLAGISKFCLKICCLFVTEVDCCGLRSRKLCPSPLLLVLCLRLALTSHQHLTFFFIFHQSRELLFTTHTGRNLPILSKNIRLFSCYGFGLTVILPDCLQFCVIFSLK